ncbi:MAG: O-antigen ligase family protein [Candidatus Omnitrophica bacterium]|nr:O-antigen ligase family protein [Candidatus Omnitrophota bacterium]
MIHLKLALSIALLAGFWLIWRRLKDISLTARIITALTAGVFFLRAILGETYFFAPRLVFQTLIFGLGFIYFVYLYLKQNSTAKLNSINPDSLISLPSSFFQNPEEKLFALFILGLAISACFSVYKAASISSLIYFSTLFVWYKLISNLPKSKNISQIFQTIILFACFVLLVYGFYQYTIGFQSMREFLAQNPEQMIHDREFIRRMQSNVVFATFLYAPAFGGYLSLMFLTILGFCLSEGSLFKPRFKPALLFKYLLLISIIPLLILTKAKGAWLGLLISLLCFIWLLKPKPEQKQLLLKALGVLISVCGLSFFLINSSDKIHLPKIANFIASFEVRWEYWKATWLMIWQRPIFGFGPGTFSSVYPMFKTLSGEETIMAHNSFLQIWAEAGSFVFIIFILFWLKFLAQASLNLKKITKNPRFIVIGLFSGIVCFLLINLIDFSLFDQQTALIAFGLMGLLQYQIIYEQELSNINLAIKSGNKTAKPLRMFFGCLCITCLLGYSSLIYAASFFDEKASQEYRNDKFKQALALTDKAINLQRNCAKYYFHRGIIRKKMIFQNNSGVSEKKDLFNKMICDFQSAANLDQFMPHYHYELALVLFNSGQEQARQNAELEFRKAAELYPVNPFYHEQLAKFYTLTGKINDARKQHAIAEEMKKYFKQGTR